MRMRRKPWARPELAACPFFMDSPTELAGHWRETFPSDQPLCLELGCGKGAFLAQAALAHPEINYLGIDLKSDVLGVAKRRIEADFSASGRTVDNIRMFAWDIDRIAMVLTEADPVDMIQINFCNPWPKASYHKKRLTHTRQLLKYRAFLKEDGIIRFKTDDDALFDASLEYFPAAGFRIEAISRDLHAETEYENFLTEHEQMFSSQGIPIKFLIARKLPEVPESVATQPEEETEP